MTEQERDEFDQQNEDLDDFVGQITDALSASGDSYELSDRGDHDNHDAVLEVWFNETRFIVRIDIDA